MADMSVVERRFDLHSGLKIAARVHNQGAPLRVLAVHGWLDNAASFDALAACLPSCEIVAIDLIGHGRSDHRRAGSWYHFVDYLDELVQVLDELGWQRSVWLGHSLGGALLAMLASAMPERVERLVLIETAGPLAGRPDQAREQLRRGLDDRLASGRARPLRVFADIGQAIDARRKVNGLSTSAARTLVERGVRGVEGGFSWSSDPRLTLASPLRIDEAHIGNLLGGIACPTLMLLADPPLPFMSGDDREARLARFPRAVQHGFAGHHHLHMETPEALAGHIREFLG
jgi:pimeloyl-ACP methyl ester carboxylesterase